MDIDKKENWAAISIAALIVIGVHFMFYPEVVHFLSNFIFVTIDIVLIGAFCYFSAMMQKYFEDPDKDYFKIFMVLTAFVNIGWISFWGCIERFDEFKHVLN